MDKKTQWSSSTLATFELITCLTFFPCLLSVPVLSFLRRKEGDELFPLRLILGANISSQTDEVHSLQRSFLLLTLPLSFFFFFFQSPPTEIDFFCLSASATALWMCFGTVTFGLEFKEGNRMKVGMCTSNFRQHFIYFIYGMTRRELQQLSIYLYLSSISILFIIISILHYIYIYTDNPHPTYFPFMVKYHFANHILALVYS